MTKRKRKEGGGDCYRVAAHWVAFADEGDDGLVCHGLVTPIVGRLKGKTFHHAWVEQYGWVIDRSNGLNEQMDIDTYYALGGIKADEVNRYTADEVRTEMLRTGHYGPWAGVE